LLKSPNRSISATEILDILYTIPSPRSPILKLSTPTCVEYNEQGAVNKGRPTIYRFLPYQDGF
jgi:hypothetical protein